jgi:glycosyltransferase involved in cell wall biosynthesis
MKKIVKQILRKFGVQISRYNPKLHEQEVITLKPENESHGNTLLSYIIEPFLLKASEPVPNTHSHFWRSLQIAKTFLELGFCVDIINYTNSSFIPRKEYSFFIDVRRNLERIAPLVNKDCVKILHIDTAHIVFHNAAEAGRLLALQRRKAVTLRPRRFEIPNQGIEHADYGIIQGNEFTISTFRYANKPIYPVPTAPVVHIPWSEHKNFEACRNRFLWFGSGGFVHKGLDLVIDAFAEMTDYHLTICGPINKENDFEKAYYKKLYQTPNIHTVGWIDISSPEFMDITNRCVGLIYPSCSEGQSGAAVTCLHAGLIPIVSYESGVDVDDFGVILNNCSIEEIQRSIKRVSRLPVPGT